MPVSSSEDEETKGRWLTAGPSPDHAEVGAYIPATLGHGSLVSIFWRGMCTREWLISALTWAEWRVWNYARESEQGVTSTLFAFGPTREVVHGDAKGIVNLLDQGQKLAEHSAYRVEFHIGGSSSQPMEFSIWANVGEADGKNLEEAGENAGIALSPGLCRMPGADSPDHWPFWFVERSVSTTRPPASRDISDLVLAVSRIVGDTPKSGVSSLSI